MTNNLTEAQRHDVHQIIDLVRAAVPEVTVTQMHKTHPPDDDGLWWFDLPGETKNIQIESSTYNCPFLIEHSGMNATSEAINGRHVQAVANEVISYLRLLMTTSKTNLP